MGSYTVDKTFTSKVTSSPNVLALASMFGLGARGDRPVKVIDNCEITIERGQVVYITGGSGAGKSLLLRLLAEQFDEMIDIDGIDLPVGKPVVDCFGDDLDRALGWLSQAGLSDAFALLRSPDQLSDGQRYRLRLAMAMAGRAMVICVDEFCAALDRVTAAVVAANVRRFADRTGTTVLVATSHDDLLEDLRPDVVVIKHLGSGADVYYPGRLKGKAS